MKSKKIILGLLGLYCLGGNFFSLENRAGATDYTTQQNGPITFDDGDSVSVTGTTAITYAISGDGTGKTINVADNGSLTVDYNYTGSQLNYGIYLNNGALNDLGSGSIVRTNANVSNVGDTNYGIKMDNTTYGSSALKADHLTVEANSNGNVWGIYSNSGAGTVDLGTGSNIKVKSTAGNAYGLATDAGDVTADHLHIDVNGAEISYGFSSYIGTGTIDLGTGSSISAKGSTAVVGVNVGGTDKEFVADQIQILADGSSSTATSKTTGVYLNGTTGLAKMDLGDQSEVAAIGGGTVGSTVGVGLQDNTEFYMNQGRITSEATGNDVATGLQMYGNSNFANLGTGTEVIVSDASKNGNSGIYLQGSNNGLSARDLALLGKNLDIGVKVGGSNNRIKITDGSTIEADGIGITMTGTNNTAFVKDTNILISPVAGLTSIGGVLVSGTGSLMEAEQVSITSDGDEYGLGMMATGAGTIRGTDISVDVQTGDGVIARDNSSLIDLKGNTRIYTDADQDYAAINANSYGRVSGTGKMDIQGHIKANIGGVVDLKMDAGSHLYGSANGNGIISLDMTDSLWDLYSPIYKEASVDKLYLTNSTVDFGALAGDYQTLTVNNLMGDGTFKMRTDLVGDGAGNNKGDFLNVTGLSSGDYLVTVQNNGSANATGDETLTIIRTADGVAEFSNTNTVELGGYEYNLREVAGSNKKEWELFGAKKVTPVPSGGGGSSTTGSAAVNIFAGSYLLNYAETQTLMKRMGDLRDGKENGNVWGRVYGGKFHSDSDSFLKDFDMNYSGVQVGADKKFTREDGKGVVYLGGFFGYTKGDVDYGYGSGDVDSKSLGAYWTHMHHNGFYADAVFKYGWMKNKFDIRDSQGNRVTADDISTRGFTGSLEVGRRYHFDQKEKNGWYVEPQAQLTVSHQNGDSFTASNGLKVKVDSYRSVMGRVGANIGYEVKGGKNPINIYGKVSVVKEFDGDIDYSFNKSPETTSYKDTWIVYGVGATAKLGTRHNLYLDVERATGGQFTQSWGVNGGYRYSW